MACILSTTDWISSDIPVSQICYELGIKTYTSILFDEAMKWDDPRWKEFCKLNNEMVTK